MLTALSIVKARVAIEQNAVIDVAWSIGSARNCWNEKALKAKIKKSIDRAKAAGLTQVKLLGYWKAQRRSRSQAGLLDAVLVGKLPTNNSKAILDAAVFLGLDRYADTQGAEGMQLAADHIASESQREIGRTRHINSFFTDHNGYILGEFEKARS